MPSNQLSDEYKLHAETLKTLDIESAFPGWKTLKKVLGADGPERDQAQALAHFRDVQLKLKPADKIIEACGIAASGAVADDAVKQAASLKFLRHLYLVGERGGQQVWVVATPKAYTKYTSDELLDVKSNAVTVKARLADNEEILDSGTRKHIGEAMILGLAWCEAAKTVLAGAASTPASMAIVKRWFAANDTPQSDVDATIEKLHAGFKKIAFAMNQAMVLVADMPQYRNDNGKTYVEAFVRNVSGSPERPRTIYIEKALYENYDISVLHDMKKNWARVLVHEATHSEVKTQDKGYAYKGIAPGTKITAANAAINADSWAFFAADCAGDLTDGDRTRALNGTGGTLTKLAKNWN